MKTRCAILLLIIGALPIDIFGMESQHTAATPELEIGSSLIGNLPYRNGM